MVLTEILSQTVNGLVFGSVLALIALGLSLIFGMLGIVNFAHGAFYALGVYIGISTIGFFGLEYGFWIAMITVPIAVALIGAGFEATTLRPIYDREDLLQPLLLTFGILLVIHGMIKYIWGPTGRTLSRPTQLDFLVPLGPVNVPAYRLFIIVMLGVVGVLLYVFLYNTDLGIIVRAATEDRSMVKVFGINVERTYTIVFAAGTGIAGFAGLLHAPTVSIFPEMGDEIIILSFVVVIVGGLTSLKGSIIAGLLVGLVSAWTFVVYPQFQEIVIFMFMAGVLLLRPHGLFGHETEALE